MSEVILVVSAFMIPQTDFLNEALIADITRVLGVAPSVRLQVVSVGSKLCESRITQLTTVVKKYTKYTALLISGNELQKKKGKPF